MPGSAEPLALFEVFGICPCWRLWNLPDSRVPLLKRFRWAETRGADAAKRPPPGRENPPQNMSTFKILKQQHPSGCIPSCAASVLRHLGIPGKPDWTEAVLLAVYSPPAQPRTPGFEILRQFLEAPLKSEGWEMVIRQGSGPDLKDLVTSIVGQYGPVLIPVTGSPAHCVVISEPDEKGAVVYDPSPNQPDQERMTWAAIQQKWIGGLLYFRRLKA